MLANLQPYLDDDLWPEKRTSKVFHSLKLMVSFSVQLYYVDNLKTLNVILLSLIQPLVSQNPGNICE